MTKRNKDFEEKLKPSVLLNNLGVIRVQKTLEHHGSLRKAAKVLGVKYITLWHWLKENAVETGGYEINYTKTVGKGMPKTGSFHYWLLTHQDVKLPRSMVQIAKLSGFSEEAVKCFFYRQRKEVRKILEELLDIRKLSITLETTEKKVIHAKTIQKYKYSLDRYSLKATLVGELNNKELFSVNIPSLEDYKKAIQSASELK